MRWSRAFIPTLREDPADAEAASHRLLVRAGFVRPLASGIWSYLPAARKALSRIEAIVREEMEGIGAQEFSLPALHPAEPWKESGRWDQIGPDMFRLKDRKGGDYCLGMTHEEIFTGIARHELSSHRQLPQIWYQIQTKFRDELRPKSGIIRDRQFTMKDSYSFDLDAAGLDRAYEAHRGAYERIFRRCGLTATMVEASSGAMGGSASAEFMVASPAGEDHVARCACGYAANLEKACSGLPGIQDPSGTCRPAPERFATPGVHTIADLERFPGGAPADRQLKTLVYVVQDKPVLLLLRGDHELSEAKLQSALGTGVFRPATPEECQKALGALPGSLGAVGVSGIPIHADLALKGRRGMATGANQDGFHFRGVDLHRDIQATAWEDLRTVQAGEPCTKCGQPLEVFKGIEVGHIFKLGTRYSEAMKARVQEPTKGAQVPVMMGSYGIGIDRILACAVELHHDADGILWPASIAPWTAVVSALNLKDEAVRGMSERLYVALRAAGVDALYDDRDLAPGAKMKDADLVGFPVRITVGPRGLKEGRVEVRERASGRVEAVQADPEAVVGKVMGLLSPAP